MNVIDLNCDMGESFGIYHLGADREILPYVTSVNIACGFHAGDPSVMRDTVCAALEQRVALGAHPGYPDLLGFGRRALAASAREVYDMVLYQIGALHAFVTAEGGKLHHVKPHGALYNVAARDSAVAEAIAEAVYRLDPGLILYGLAGSELLRAAERLGLATASEVFADRAYAADGSLVPRTSLGALVHDEEAAVARAIRMIVDGRVTTVDGTELPIRADTLCVHSDTRGALGLVKRVRSAFAERGITVRPVGVETL